MYKAVSRIWSSGFGSTWEFLVKAFAQFQYRDSRTVAGAEKFRVAVWVVRHVGHNPWVFSTYTCKCITIQYGYCSDKQGFWRALY